MASTAAAAAASSSSGLGGQTDTEQRKYTVLYYKRKKKVHKTKGVSRLDGTLTVEPPPSCRVFLHDDLSPTTKLISSGINWKISKQAFGIEEDGQGNAVTVAGSRNEFRIGRNGLSEGDVVELSQWDCEITGILNGGGGSVASGCSAGAGLGRGIPGRGIGGGIVKTAKRQSNNLLVGRKRPLGGGGLGGGRPAGGLVSRTTGLGGGLAGGKSVGRPGLGGNNSSSGSSSSLIRGGIARRPPPQPIKRPASQDDDSDTGEENQLEVKSNLLKNPPLSSLLGGGKKRRVGVGNVGGSNGGLRRGLGATASSSAAAAASSGSAAATGTSSSAADSFPGAIGTIVTPASIRGILRPHQREGVTFLWNCLTGASPYLNRVAEESGAGPEAARVHGCILADEMGLGKTLMTIATLFALHRRNRENRFVVVCPSSLVGNWAKEFDKWISKASQPKRVVIRKGGESGLQAIKSFVPVKPNMSEILIVSYELFRMNISVLEQAEQIGLLVVDEGHRLKNTSGSQTLTALNALRCEARLLITGTPIQNNLSEFHNVVNFVCPGILGDIGHFRRTYERPINASNSRAASGEQRAKGRSLSRALDKITSTFMLRRLQRDVLRDHLPPRSETLLFCRPSERQQEEYLRLTKGVKGGAGPSSAGVSADALTLLTKVRKLCSHPYLLNSEDDDPFSTEAGGRAGMDDDVSEDAERCEHVELSGKLSLLESLLSAIRSEAPMDKVVVISNFTSALTIIEKAILQRRKWASIRLDGSTEQNARQSLVDSFNRGSVDQSFVFLLSSKAGGCGLNLIGANRLVMFDPDWNPATDQQAMARVYRQGQNKSCYIYRLLTSGTVEEVVYQRQSQKSNLATLTVDGQGSSKKSGGGFTKEELRDCFTLKVGTACDTKRKVGKRWEDYDGVNSLQDQGCADAPLLAIADECSGILGFVHLVPEQASSDQKKSAAAKLLKEEDEEDEESSDDDEAIFDEPFKRKAAKKKVKTGFLDELDGSDDDGLNSDDFSSEEEFED